jgi:hypothetical protein
MPTDHEVVKKFMIDAREIVDELEYNENLSPAKEIKIMFNAYGDDDELGEGMDKNIETYYMFVHKDSLKKGFVFPEHKLFRGTIVHHLEEVKIPVIYNVEEDFWDINFLDDYKLDEKQLSNILLELYKRYYK